MKTFLYKGIGKGITFRTEDVVCLGSGGLHGGYGG